MAKVKIEKDPENKIELKVLEQAIVDVADAAKKLNGSKLSRRAVVLLLQDQIGNSRISKSQVASVLDAAESLAKVYLK